MTTASVGTAVIMLWAVLLIVTLLGVALPALLWWLTSRMTSARPPYARRRRDTFGFPMDAVDAWFADHAELPALRRLSVRSAVFDGRAVDDESLRPVAHRLAADLLAGRIRSEVSGWASRVLVGAGAAEMIITGVLCLLSGHVLPWLVSPASYGVLLITLGLVRPRLLRRRLERSLQLNT